MRKDLKPSEEPSDWYVFRFTDDNGCGVHAVAREGEGGLVVRAKIHSDIEINFANKLIDEWIKSEFFEDEEDLDNESDGEFGSIAE